MDTIKTRISNLRKIMKEKNIDVYYIPTSDFHDSEYVSEFFKCRQYMSGFTGSAGTLIVGMKEAGLFTDGRYYIQAEKELKGSSITLYKTGEPDCPTIFEYITKLLKDGGKIGFDGRVVSGNFVEKLINNVERENIGISYNQDLVGKIWKDRPKQHFTEPFVLQKKYSGEGVDSKLDKLRMEMYNEGANVHLLSSLDDIAWLFNIRGNDIHCNPVVQSFSVVFMDRAYLFLGRKSTMIESHLKKYGVEVKDYKEIYSFIKNNIEKTDVVMLDANRVNYKLLRSLPVKEFVDVLNPTTFFKAIKNKTEIKNLKAAHLKDGVVVTKFIYELKKNVGKTILTEKDAEKLIDSLRNREKTCIGQSFDTISAYNENAAMMHYSAKEGKSATLKKEGMLLVDSGGQYFEGTTDVTRTIALGKVSAEMKLHFTYVLKSMLRLGRMKFLYGCTGQNLDAIARGPLWEIGIDYKCGTGHGVGYLLNVHEGPNSFRFRSIPGVESAVLEEGMVTTDEPGVYLEGKYGIRTENELLCKKWKKCGSDQFMEFEHLTLVPIDLDLIEKKYLDSDEIKALNDYHAMVYEKIGPELSENERKWLEKNTRAI